MTGWRHRYILPKTAGLALSICVFVIASNLRAQEDLAGGADFNALLRAKTRIAPLVDGAPLSARQHVNDLRSLIGIPIFLDRRVDPDAGLTIDLPEMRVELAMREFALLQKKSLVVRDGYLYFGPRSLCRNWPGELDVLSKQVGKLPAADKQFWEAKSPLTWEDGAMPRELAERIAGGKLSKSEVMHIEHDIWAEFAGPPLPRWEQIALVCAGFDLIPNLSAKGELTLRQVAEGKVQSALVNVNASSISEAIENIQRYFPEVKATPKQGKLGIEGSIGDVRAIQAWFAAPPASKKPPASKSTGPVSLLKTPVPVPARQLLVKLAQDAKCELLVSPDVPSEAINKAIKPNWTGTRDELLKKISEEIGLLCELREGKILVSNR